MATLDQFYPYILPEVPGCSEPLADQRILSACIEFCKKSHYWEYTHPAINLVADQPTYALTLPANSQLVTVIDPIYYNGQKIEQRTKEWLDQYKGSWQTSQGMTPYCFMMPLINVIRPVPYPDAALVGGIEEIKLVLKPDPAATTVEDFLFDEFFENIADGAKHKLMSMPGKEWSNPELSLFYKTLFDDAIIAARTKVKSGYKQDHRYKRSRAHYF